MIQIITIATGEYKFYSEYFIQSITKFFPNERKQVVILSDALQEYNGFAFGNVEINVIYLNDFLYPTINMNKPVLFNQYLDANAEFSFLIDIDTVFIEKDNKTWENLKQRLKNSILLTKHPFYSLSETGDYCGIPRENVIRNLYTENLTEKDDRFCSYIPDEEYTYINSAIWGGSPEEVKKFNNAIINMEKQDLTRYPNGFHIPKYMDENYVNRIAYNNYKLNDKTFSLVMDAFSALYNSDSILTDNTIVFQKNMGNHKKY